MSEKLKYCRINEEKNVLSSLEDAIPVEETCFIQFLLKRFDKYASKVYMSEAKTGKSLTFQQVKEKSIEIANALTSVCQVKPQDAIFGYSPNNINLVCSMFATTFAGCTYSGCLANLTAVSLAPQVADCAAKVIFCVRENALRTLQAVEKCPSVEYVILLDDTQVPSQVKEACPPGIQLMTFDHLVASRPVDRDNQFPITTPLDPKKQIVSLLYSSGSTGMPKGAQRSAYALMHMCYNVCDIGLWWGQEDEVTACFQSLGHTSGSMTLFLTLFNGSRVILIEQLQVEQFLELVSTYRVNVAIVAPTIIRALTQVEDVSGYDLTCLKTITASGAPLPPGIVAPFVEKFPLKDRLNNCYALTETQLVTYTPANCGNYESVGSLARSVQVKIVNRDTGTECSFNETGEVFVRSHMCTGGYLNRDDANRDTFSPDGWVMTGDAGYFDTDGLLYIVDRFKEMIKVHSYQVAPAELESILYTHPLVKEACVVATSHPVTGETPRAFVVPASTDSLPPEDDLIKYVNEQIVEYRRINGGLFFVESLPKISFGKFNRQLLKKTPEKLIFLNKLNVPTCV